MAKWIHPSRVRLALSSLNHWQQDAKSQPAMHLWPLLAIIEKGANSNTPIVFGEEDDRDFWDRYARLPEDTRDRKTAGEFTEGFYVEPLTLKKKPSDYYHRSPATIRDRTFLNAWKAASFKPETNQWVLDKGYADVIVQKVLTKDGEIHRVPVVDLAIWLFRDQEFPDDITAKKLEGLFKSTFRFSTTDYGHLFQFTEEDTDSIFTPTQPSHAELATAIEDALIPDGPVVPAVPDEPPVALVAPDSEDDRPPPKSSLTDEDVILAEVKKLLAFGTSGIILRGCPGTSKTWYAKQLAYRLVTKLKHVFRVQFHPSYGYEDFVEGYQPNEQTTSGFEVVDKVFLKACEAARKVEDKTPVVFIIDEINRGDPSRIFGELLTYIEHGYRGDEFSRAYTGKPSSVPPNLVIIGTMNQHDRSVTQLDLALVRRFDHIDLNPSSETVQDFLEKSKGFTSAQISRIVSWFETLQKPEMLPFGIGHTYFKDVKTPEELQTVWRYRILPYCQSVLELEPPKLVNVKRSFEGMYRSVVGQAGDS